MTNEDLINWVRAQYCRSDSVVAFINLLISTRPGYLTLHESGQKVLFDTLVITDHDDLCCVIRMDKQSIVSIKAHYSYFSEYVRLDTVERAYEEHKRMGAEITRYCVDMEDRYEDEIRLDADERCPSCDRGRPVISGDNVYFGYTGAPLCIECVENINPERKCDHNVQMDLSR